MAPGGVGDDTLPKPPTLSQITTSPDIEAPRHEPYLHHLASRVQHNLQYQHHWTEVQVHTHSPNSTLEILTRPLISGLPPQRLYIHPDEQVELLQQSARKNKTSGDAKHDEPEPDTEFNPDPEREWVLPTHLREKWSVKKFAEIFDAITLVPPQTDPVSGNDASSPNRWRTLKRVLLATVDDDSTIVYYIVHDGVVKPRQN
jgi:tRNA-splicing endonuclease subunit Sen15, fungi type